MTALKKENWIIYNKGADFQSIARQYHTTPAVARVARNRGIITESQLKLFFSGGRDDLHDPYMLKDAKKGAQLLCDAIKEKKRIRICGDYDNDGINSTYILYDGLKNLGALIDYRIPDRIKDGYGINEQIIDEAIRNHIDLIITCDNGISAYESVKKAKENNIQIIVTDHHEIPFEVINDKKTYRVPPADAVINPKQEDCQYPYKGLCGAAVAWKFLFCVYNEFEKDTSSLWKYIENVGFATVCDVMDLVDENRIFVKLGLEELNRTSNVGLTALIAANGLYKGEINAYHLGFVLGPCTNASGRLETADECVRLFSCKDYETALTIASHLTTLNAARKQMTEKGLEAAIYQIEHSEWKDDKVYVIFLPEVHESIAGIIAGKVREKYNKPCFVLTRGNNHVKGSGRSIEEYSMYEELNKCKELLIAFGGHPMAAGLSLEESRIDKLRHMLVTNCSLTENDIIPKVYIDAQLPLGCVSEDFVNELTKLEPHGKGNAKPVFAEKDLEILYIRRIGRKNNMLDMTIRDKNGTKICAKCFLDADTFIREAEAAYGEEEVKKLFSMQQTEIRFSATFFPTINEFKNSRTLQVVITHYDFPNQRRTA